MIKEICRVTVCLALGEILSHLLPIAIPAPVLGLVLLFTWLVRHGGVPEALGVLADRLLELFGLFFVPAGVGIVACGNIPRADGLAIVLAVTIGTLVTIACTGLAAMATTRHETRANGGMTWAEADS